jgi:hypothetical protein
MLYVLGDSKVIKDCRGKETMRIARRGGDLALIFINETNEVYEIWFEMRKPYKQTYEKISKLFAELENHLVIRNSPKDHKKVK